MYYKSDEALQNKEKKKYTEENVDKNSNFNLTHNIYTHYCSGLGKCFSMYEYIFNPRFKECNRNPGIFVKLPEEDMVQNMAVGSFSCCFIPS